MSSEPSASPDESPPPPPLAKPADAPAPPSVSEVGFTRAAALWSSLTFGLLILVVLLVFIAQNTDTASITFLKWRWSLPIGVQILLAAVGGALLTVLAGATRLIQLRRAAKKNLKAALKN